jgi:hypothetical protein
VALILGTAFLIVTGRRWSRARPIVAARDGMPPGPEETREQARYRAELAEALRRLDS